MSSIVVASLFGKQGGLGGGLNTSIGGGLGGGGLGGGLGGTTSVFGNQSGVSGSVFPGEYDSVSLVEGSSGHTGVVL